MGVYVWELQIWVFKRECFHLSVFSKSRIPEANLNSSDIKQNCKHTYMLIHTDLLGRSSYCTPTDSYLCLRYQLHIIKQRTQNLSTALFYPSSPVSQKLDCTQSVLRPPSFLPIPMPSYLIHFRLSNAHWSNLILDLLTQERLLYPTSLRNTVSSRGE